MRCDFTVEKSGVFCEFQKGHTGRCGFIAEYAHYDNGWYYCWLIERRDQPQPEWFGADCFWKKDANEAEWYARKSDAETVASEMTDIDVIICEHGFDLGVAHRADVARVEECVYCDGNGFRMTHPAGQRERCFACNPVVASPTAQPAEAGDVARVVEGLRERAESIRFGETHKDSDEAHEECELLEQAIALLTTPPPSPSDELRAAVEAAITVFAKGPPLTPDRNYALEKRYEDYAQLLRDWVAGR